MLDAKTMFLGCVAYLRENPQEVFRVARKSAHGRFGLPVAAIQWLTSQFESNAGPHDIEVEACPPGIRVTATVEEMGTLLRGSAVLSVVSVEISAEQLLVEVRLADVSLKLLDDAIATPLAALVRSGALDLTRVANLVAHMPERPKVLVEAEDDRLILDFMKLPRFADNERLRKCVGAVALLLQVETVETDESHVEVALRAFPKGITALFQ
jgi:hypothetical protein